MKKSAKILVLILSLVVLAAAAFALVACDKGGGNELKAHAGQYNIGVYLEDGSPVEGVSVQLCIVVGEDPLELGECYNAKATDKNGISTQVYAEELMQVHIMANSVPEGYAVKDAELNPEGTIYTLDKLIAIGEAMKVVLVKQA